MMQVGQRRTALMLLLAQFACCLCFVAFDIEPADAEVAKAIPVNGGGLGAVQFHTKNGDLRVNLPDDTSEGDTISGTVVLEPKGRNESEQSRNEDELNGYVVEIADQNAPARLGDFKCVMPTTTDVITLVLKDKKGTTVCKTQKKILQQPPPLPCAKYPGTCMLPPFAQAGWPIQCRGPCDGDFNNGSIKIAGKEVTRLCESPRKVVAECPPNVCGATTIEMREGGVVATAAFTILAVQLQCGVNDIERGKSTTLTVTVSGLDGITEPATLQVNNLSPNVVTLEGGNKQEVKLAKQDGIWQRSTNINALRSGPFSIVAWILEPAIINVTRFKTPGQNQTQTILAAQQPPTSSNAANLPGISGQWSSTYGPMVLEEQPGEGSVKELKGYWQQAADKRGVIEGGTYDPKTGVVQFAYYEHWVNVHGVAQLMLSADGKTLEGVWTQAGTTGKWTLKR